MKDATYVAEHPIVVFDSGIGGLNVLREVRALLPERHLVYVADDGGFPYGDWNDEALRQHLVALVGRLTHPRTGYRRRGL